MSVLYGMQSECFCVFVATADLSDVEAGGETLFPLLHNTDTPFLSSLDNEPGNLRKVSAFLDDSGRVTNEQSEHNHPHDGRQCLCLRHTILSRHVRPQVN